MQDKYRKLKRNCIIFGMLIILLSSVSWGIARVALSIVELFFFLYLVHWIDPNKKQREHMKLIFFCLFIVGVGFGGMFSSIVLKGAASASTILAAMLYLYSIKVPIIFDRNFISRFFSAMIYFPFAYVNTFWETENLGRIERIKKQKIINGIIFTFVIVLMILIPLYAVGDKIFGAWIEIIVGWLWENILNFLAAIILGWIPAMLVYSYMRGLEISDFPYASSKRAGDNIDEHKMFFNLFSVKAILIGSTAINCLFIISQFVYFFETNKNYEEINGIGHMIAILSALILNSMFLIVLTLGIKEKGMNNYSISISSLNVYYALSIIAVWVSLCWRYVVVVFDYGLKGIWPLWGLIMLVVLAVVAWNIMGVLRDYQKFVKSVCYGMATLLILFNICIPEYWIGKINVTIFNYKYDNHLLINDFNDDTDISVVIVESQDLDIDYIKTLDEWSIPAFIAVKNIPNYYGDSGQTISTIAEEGIFAILESDLTVKEIEIINELGQDERQQRVINMLEEKTEYRLPGKKRVILNMVKEAYAHL